MKMCMSKAIILIKIIKIFKMSTVNILGFILNVVLMIKSLVQKE